MNERAIFIEALEIADPDERAAHLERACGTDDALRRRVERLLQAHGRPGGFMDVPAAELVADEERHVAERPGTLIGPYKLVEPLGEGGFGLVFVAEQQEPVRRAVALKILKPGMDTRQVVARFEAERQALALMDHPNIAKVHDGGVTPSGRPYFVMELVKGVPVTEFCDQNHLSPRQRLELFVQVCQAVQHAHQKGIIHRDLKPSNVLVERHDKPVPKVIDFGVAKSLGRVLTDKTIFTGPAQVVGTPLYMSPEQAGGTGLDVDTRSDIYSLGVLLYELLTGTTPFDRERFRQADYGEICRIVREEDPPRPSTRLSELGSRSARRVGADTRHASTTLASVASRRHTEAARLTRLVRGELDWIVMKALEKDRNRRYETAEGFAQDVRRYLEDQPVLAGPPTLRYRFRKFARRNRRALLAAGVIGCALLSAVGAVGWAVYDRSAREENARLEREEAGRVELARRARVEGQIQILLDDVTRSERQQHWPEALDAARRAADLVARGDVEPEIAERVQDSIRDLELVRLLEDIRADKSDWKGGSFNYRATADRYGAAFRDGGIDVARLTAEDAARRLRSRPVVSALVPILDDWAACRARTGDRAGAEHLWNVAGLTDPDPWRQRLRQAVLKNDRKALLALATAPDLERQPAATLTDLATHLRLSGNHELQVGDGQFLSTSIRPISGPVDDAIKVLLLARRHYPSDFWVHYELGSAFDIKGNVEQAAGCYRTAVALRPRNAAAWTNLGAAMQNQNLLADAIACFEKAIEIDSSFVTAHLNLGGALRVQQKWPEAAAAYHKALELDPQSALAYHGLGRVLWGQRKVPEAIAAHRKAVELEPAFAFAYNDLGIALRDRKELPEAAAALRKAVELKPDFAAAHTNLGMVLFDQKNLPDAIACHRKAIALDPKLAVAHHNLGKVLLVQHDAPGAVAALEQALALDPRNPELLQNYSTANSLLGVTHLSKGRADEAVSCFKKAIELGTRDHQVRLFLGIALSQKGMPDEAAAAYLEAIRLKPDYGEALHLYARLLVTRPDAKARNPAEAVKLAKKAVGLPQPRGIWWNTLGIAQYRSGEWKDALAALEKSMELRKGGNAGDWYFAAMAHWRLDRKGEARRWYDRAVQWTEKNAPQDEDLRRFRAEAAELLGVKE